MPGPQRRVEDHAPAWRGRGGGPDALFTNALGGALWNCFVSRISRPDDDAWFSRDRVEWSISFAARAAPKRQLAKASFKHAQPDGYWHHAKDQPVAQTPILTPNLLY